ncbi:MAG: hypothetical protein ACRDJW_25205 [Thermomicrobiales bacterium]
MADAPDAIVAHVDALREDGQTIPDAHQIILTTVRAPGRAA